MAFALWVGTLSPSYQQCDTDGETQNRAQAEENALKLGRWGIPHEIAVIWNHFPLFARCEATFLDENSATVAAVATIFIAAFTLTLWRATNKLWEAGEEQGRAAQLAAEAARDTAESYMTGECAHIFPAVPDMTQFLPTGAYVLHPIGPDTPLPRVHLRFANVGKTYGVIQVLRGEIAIGALALKREFHYSHEIRGSSILVKPTAETEPIPFDFHRNLTTDEINEIGVGTAPVFIFGYILYMDIFGYYHGRSFAFRVKRGRQSSVELTGGSEYNYRTKTKLSEASWI